MQVTSTKPLNKQDSKERNLLFMFAFFYHYIIYFWLELRILANIFLNRQLEGYRKPEILSVIRFIIKNQTNPMTIYHQYQLAHILFSLILIPLSPLSFQILTFSPSSCGSRAFSCIFSVFNSSMVCFAATNLFNINFLFTNRYTPMGQNFDFHFR